MTRIVKAVQTCWACPSQWDAYTDRGEYLYLRFRHGYGSATWYAGGYPNNVQESRLVGEFTDPDPYAGSIGLAEFCQRAGLVLDPMAEVS